jgi:hypothetical protein
MPTAQHNILKWLSAAVWYGGGVVLMVKGGGWLLEAGARGATAWPVGAAGAAAVVGLVRGRTVFRRACVRNLERIRTLNRPRLWQVFRPAFFIALAAMFSAMALFGWLARTGYPGMVVVGGLDLVIGISLLTGASAFWTWAPEAPGEGSAGEPLARRER